MVGNEFSSDDLPVDGDFKHSLAPLKNRFWAGLVDLGLIGALAFIIKFVLMSWDFANEDTLFALCFFGFLLIFWVVPLLQSGQTPGKKIFGLKIIYDSSDDGLPISIFLLREVLLKFFSFASLGYLFWNFSPREKTTSFHDHYSKTFVVLLDEHDSGAGFFQKLSVSPIHFFFLIVMAVGLYLAFGTAFPLYRMTEELEASGISIQNISGNALKGFTVEKVSFNYKDCKVSLDHLTFQAELSDFLWKKNVTLTKMRIENFQVTQEIGSSSLKPSSEGNQNFFSTLISPGMVNVSQWTIDKAQIFSKQYQNLHGSDFSKSSSFLKMAELNYSENSYDLQIKNFDYSSKDQTFRIFNGSFLIKPSMYFRLKREFLVSFQVEGNFAERFQYGFTVSAFEGHLRAHQNSQSLVVRANDLSLQEFLDIPPPIEKISLTYFMDPHPETLLENPLIVFTQEAEVTLRGQKFRIGTLYDEKQSKDSTDLGANPKEASHCKSYLCLKLKDRTFALSFDLVGLTKPNNGTQGKLMRLEDITRRANYNSAIDVLSSVYYAKSSIELTPAERQIIEIDKDHYTLPLLLAADSRTLPVIQIRGTEKPNVSNTALKKAYEALKREKNALRVYDALVALHDSNGCQKISSLPSDLMTDLILQQPNLKAPIYNILGSCSRKPQDQLLMSLEAYAADPKNFQTKILLGQAYSNLMKPEFALQILEPLSKTSEFQSQKSNHALVYHLLASNYTIARKYDLALESLQKLRRLRSNPSDNELLARIQKLTKGKSLKAAGHQKDQMNARSLKIRLPAQVNGKKKSSLNSDQ